MVIKLKSKATVVLPKEVAKQLKLKTEDDLDIKIVDGSIIITPVVVCPKKYVNELHTEINKAKKAVEQEEIFNGVDEVVSKIDEQ